MKRWISPCASSLSALCLLAGCVHGGGDLPDAGGSDVVDAGSADAAPLHVPSECPSADQMPTRDPSGNVQCVPVGPAATCNPSGWPDVSTRPSPQRFVDPAADATLADGTMAHPFVSVSAALGSLPAGGTIALHAGNHLVATGPLRITAATTIVGSGTTCTMVTGEHGNPVFRAQGIATTLVLESVTVQYAGTDAATGTDRALEAPDGAEITLRDVSIVAPGVGVAIAGGALDATRVSIDRALEDGVLLTSGALGTLRSCAVRRGFGLDTHAGIRATDSYVTITDSLVFHNAGYGVSVRGTPAGGRGADDCAQRTTSGERSCLSNVAITCDGYAGLSVRDAVRLDVRRSVLSGTVGIGGEFGDGIEVGNGSVVRLDPDVDLGAVGGGSEIVGNQRHGVFASGAGTAVSVRGALLGSNGAAGVFVQSGARADEVAASIVDDNGALGIGVAYDGIAGSISANQITHTRDVPLMVTGQTLVLGDGLSVTPSGVVDVHDNVISDNRRFGAIFVNASGTLLRNAGTGNRFGLGVYNAPALTVDNAAAIAGTDPAPSSAPPHP